jgi:hypothetical protein
MSAAASANRRVLWLLVAVAVTLFFGSLLFIISRAH